MSRKVRRTALRGAAASQTSEVKSRVPVLRTLLFMTVFKMMSVILEVMAFWGI